MRQFLESNHTRLGRACFDATFYELADRDIANAVRLGQIPSAYWHYERYGRREARATARNWLPFLARPRWCALFKPNEDFFSGVNVTIAPGVSGSLKFVVFRISGFMISYIFIVNVDVEAVLENGSGYIAFDAAAPEWKGKTFLGVMFRFDRSKCLPRLTRFVVTPKRTSSFRPLRRRRPCRARCV